MLTPTRTTRTATGTADSPACHEHRARSRAFGAGAHNIEPVPDGPKTGRTDCLLEHRLDLALGT